MKKGEGTNLNHKQLRFDHAIQISQHEEGFIEITGHDGKNKITVRNSKIPIESSGPEKYSELEAINKQILSMTVVPDFGYQEKTMGDESVAGWRLLYDYVKKSPKMIKLQNIVQQRLIEKEKKEKERLLQL